jgi:hypothetical protein
MHIREAWYNLCLAPCLPRSHIFPTPNSGVVAP